VNTDLPEQRKHHVGTAIPVEHRDVAALERRKHFAQQGGFPGLLARIGGESRVKNHRRGKRQHDTNPHDRTVQAVSGATRIRFFMLREFRLIFHRIGHGGREAVDEFGVMLVFPKPFGWGDGFGIFCNKSGEFVKSVNGELGSCATIISVVAMRHSLTDGETKGGDTSHGGGAGAGFAIGEGL